MLDSPLFWTSIIYRKNHNSPRVHKNTPKSIYSAGRSLDAAKARMRLCHGCRTLCRPYFLPLFLMPWVPVLRGPLPPALAAISLRAFSSAVC